MSGVLMGAAASGGASGAVSIADQSISNSGAGVTTASYTLTNGGAVQDHVPTTLETWLLSGAAGDYEAYVTKTGDALASGTLGSWLLLSTTRTWSLTATVSPSTKIATLTVKIRNATSLVELDTATVTLTAERS